MRRILSIVGRIAKEGFWVAVAVALVFGGVRGFQYLGDSKEVVEASPVERPLALVETITLEPLDGALPIRGEGFVRPLRQVALSSQVGGRITYVHPAIYERSRFEAGTVLARIDDRAAIAAYEQANANISATEARIAQNNQDIGRVERLVERGVSTRRELDDLLANRDELAANLNGLYAARLSAEIAREDRAIVAPFDGAVLSEDVEVGNVVAAGQVLAEIYTEGDLEIDVPIRQADAALIPGLFSGEAATATIDIPFAGYTFRWNGEVSRVQSQVDRNTRTLTVTLRLGDLVGRDGQSLSGDNITSGAPPALIDSYAKVIIDGAEAASTFRIPSTALRGGDAVWLFDNDTLAIADATPVHVDGEDTYISASGFAPGMQVITSALSAPVGGIPLRDGVDRRQAQLTE